MNKQRREENENAGGEGREKVSGALDTGRFTWFQPLFPTSSPSWPSSSKAVQITTCLISKSSFNVRPPPSPNTYNRSHTFICITILQSFLSKKCGRCRHPQTNGLPELAPRFPRDRQEYCLVLNSGETPHPRSTGDREGHLPF